MKVFFGELGTLFKCLFLFEGALSFRVALIPMQDGTDASKDQGDGLSGWTREPRREESLRILPETQAYLAKTLDWKRVKTARRQAVPNVPEERFRNFRRGKPQRIYSMRTENRVSVCLTMHTASVCIGVRTFCRMQWG